METSVSGMSSPTTPGVPIVTPSPIRVGVKGVNMQRMVDEMRQHIAKLKADLESERAKNKQLHRDKITEIKQVKEACDKDKEHALHNLEMKLHHDKQVSLQKQKDASNKERDQEIRQILKNRDDEIKQMKSITSKEKEEAVKVALELQKKSLTEHQSNGGPISHVRPGSGNSALIVKLQREIKSLKDSAKDLEERLRQKTEADAEKTEQIRQIQINHEAQIAKIVEEYKAAPGGEVQDSGNQSIIDTEISVTQSANPGDDPSRLSDDEPDSIGAELNCDNSKLGGTWTIESGASTPDGNNQLEEERQEVSTSYLF